IVIGDPENGEFFILKTSDGGKNWNQISGDNIPDPGDGEALFAASGTCIITYGKNNAWFVTGGISSARVFYSTDKGESWKVADTPVTNGASSKGIFSVAFYDTMNGIIVGGDYAKDTIDTANAAITTDGGKSWNLIEDKHPEGFRSCVNYIPGTKGKGLMCCGTSGIDYSIDGGESWENLNNNSYHVVSFGDSFNSGWLSGGGGRIAKIVFE
ncbi:WD40/YVTN/BNR-like repeat-containing protein, partial [Bacteroidota bacterium]